MASFKVWFHNALLNCMMRTHAKLTHVLFDYILATETKGLTFKLPLERKVVSYIGALYHRAPLLPLNQDVLEDHPLGAEPKYLSLSAAHIFTQLRIIYKTNAIFALRVTQVFFSNVKIRS